MQKVVEAVRIAFRSLRSYRLRALLTMLGISIGIFAITIVFTLVNSMQYSVGKNLSALGNTVLFVHNWPWKDNSDDWYKYYNRPKMSYSDFEKLKNNLEKVDGAAFHASKNGAVVRTKKRVAEGITVRGVTYDYRLMQNFEFARGRYFTRYETEAGRNVCILGDYLARSLFDAGPYIGQKVTVKGRPFTVVGVLEEQGKNLFGENQDEFFVTTYPAFSRVYDVSSRRVDKLVIVRAASHEVLPEVESNVVALVRLNRGLKPGTEDNFSINKQETLMEQLNSIFEKLNIGGSIISLFSLLIGGFGIANIMFVSVKERTKEIGIQKALGATRGFILAQFLAEAALLCILGGLLGLALLFLTAWGVGALTRAIGVGLEIVIAPQDLLLAVGLSAAIGIVSGLAPSLLAARMNPVDAIRSK